MRFALKGGLFDREICLRFNRKKFLMILYILQSFCTILGLGSEGPLGSCVKYVKYLVICEC